MLTPVRIELGPLIKLSFQVQHSPFWANLAFTYNTHTLLLAPYIVMLY